MAKISAIVPVYNVEPYLNRLVESVLSQTYRDFELILVDDGSTDRSGSICDEYKVRDSRVVVIHQKNGGGGASAARNAGIDWAFANSSSEYLTFIDADDWLEKECFDVLVSLAKKFGSEISVCSHRETFGEVVPVSVKGVLGRKISPTEFWIIDWRMSNVPWAKLYAKQLFANVRFPLRKLNEDAFVTYKVVFAATSIGYADLPLYNYYVRPDNHTNKNWGVRRFDEIQAIWEQLKFFDASDNANVTLYVCNGLLHLLLDHISRQRALNLYHGECKAKYVDTLKSVISQYGKCIRVSDEERLALYREVYPIMYFVYRFKDVIRRRGICGSLRRVLFRAKEKICIGRG